MLTRTASTGIIPNCWSRRWRGSLALTAVLILFKEDAPLLVIVVAAMILAEDVIRLFGRDPPRRWNWPATVMLVLAAGSVPLLLYFMKTQQVAGVPTNFARLRVAGSIGINNAGALFSYGINNLSPWLKSTTVAGWLALAVPATFGLILVRPHLLVAGVLTTLVAWLVQEDLLWAPRVVQALAFFQLAGGLALASAWQLLRDGRTGTWRARVVAGGVILLLGWGVGWGLWRQVKAVPKTTEVYRLNPILPVSAAEREQADRLFARYRREGKKTDPVIAGRHLLRYAHDRNLFWVDRLAGKPKPVWILWDRQQSPLSWLWAALKTDAGIEPSEYRLVERSGRFLLLKRQAETGPAPRAEAAIIPGEAHGQIRLRARFPAPFASLSEPLLAVGAPGRGELFFVRYFDNDQLALGFADRTAAVYLSAPVAYEPGREYEMGFFSDGLLPAEADGGSVDPAQRLRYQNVVAISWNGKSILNSRARHFPVESGAGIYLGQNVGQTAGVGAVFTGDILAASRGGYPVPATGAASDCGAIRLVVDLSGTAAGVPEPLLVVGMTGEATLVYLRLLPGGQARVGVEFWGVGAPESEPFALANPGRAEIVVQLPGLYPPEDDIRWGGVPAARQQMLRTSFRVVVDGVARLAEGVKAPIPRQPGVFYGVNPAGGSWVREKFSGTVVQAYRLPIDAP